MNFFRDMAARQIRRAIAKRQQNFPEVIPGGIGLSQYDVAGALRAGLVAWYDFSDLATLTIVSGDHISAIADKSYNGLTASQATDSKRPTLDSGVIQAGLSNARCQSAASQNMQTARYFFAGLTLSVYAVARYDSLKENCVIGSDFSGGPRLFGLDYTAGASINFNTWNTGGSAFTAFKAADSTKHLICGVRRASGLVDCFVDNVIGTPANLTGTPTTGPARLSIGASDQFDSFTLNGRVGEVLIYSGEHDVNTRGIIYTYLKSKWGTP